MTADLPTNEAARLDALRRLNVLDTPPEGEFDGLTRVAAAVCGTPIALISLIDEARQWFKARVGLDATETPRGLAFCAHAILGDDLFVVPNATDDPRFRANPLVTGDPNIRFYAGMPLTTPDGFNLGTLCAIDRVPRTMTPVQQDALRVLGRQVVTQLMLRRRVENLEVDARHHETFRVLFEHSSDAHLIFDERDGILDCNHATVAMLRCRDKGEVLALHPAVLSPELQPDGRRSLEKCVEMDATARRNGFHRFDWTHRRADGEDFPCEVTLTPVGLHGRSALLVVWHDLTERKRAEDALRASEDRFRAFMDNSPAVAFLKDEAGRFVYVNEPFVRTLNVTREAWLGKTDFDLWPRAVAQQFHDNDTAIRTGGGPVRLIETTPGGDGSLTYWHVHKFPFAAADGRQLLGGLAVDVTAEKKAEDALRQSEDKFRNTIDRLAEGVYVVDAATGRFVEANATLLAMLGYTFAEFAALTLLDLVTDPPAEYAPKYAAAAAALARDGRYDAGRKPYRRKDGSTVMVEVRITVVPNGGAGLHAVIVRDVSEQIEHENRLFEYQAELEAANAKLKALATTDGLTGVKNRAAFNTRLAEEFDRAMRYGHPLSVVLLDVDHFKLFNDTFGHPAGDAVLKAVGGTLQSVARTTDVVARYGGEEFAVILPETDYAGAIVLAERCRRAVAGGAWDKRPITVSVGVSTLAATTADAAALVSDADQALYRSKHAGRNRVHHSSGAVSAAAVVRR